MDQTPFSQQIASLSRGTLDAELTDELMTLVKAINDHGKKGTLTLTLTLKPRLTPQSREVHTIEITPDVKLSLPKPDRLSSRMWPTVDGDLLRNDPKQPELDLREVDHQPGEAKEL